MITYFSILEKISRIVDQAGREGIIFDTRFKFTKPSISEISYKQVLTGKMLKKSSQVKENSYGFY